jgi:protein associated with RNAse G/E
MVPTIGGHVWVERRKWPDRPHYGSEGIVLGEDQHGVWVGARQGDRMYKGTESPVSGRYAIVWCIPPAGWFLAHFLVGHPDLDIYIDIAAPAKWSERGASLVDLDFDVVVWNDGRRPELVDEDEFEDHRVRFGYPDDLVESARAAATDVFAKASLGEPPFRFDVAAPWLAAVTDQD